MHVSTGNALAFEEQEKGGDLYGIGKVNRNAVKETGISSPHKEADKDADIYGTGDAKREKIKELRSDGVRSPNDKNIEENDIYSIMRGKKTAYEEVVVINRPPNIQGLTGLLVTNSAFTQPKGGFAAGVSFISEDSRIPDYSVVQIPLTVTYGITDTVELGLKGKALRTENMTDSLRERGAGDTDIFVKWRFSPEVDTFPALAVGLGGMFPTGNENRDLNEVVHWGVKVIALASSEARIMDESFLGLYVEAQAVFIDELTKASGNTPGAERYGIINTGMLFPIAAAGRLQAIVEYNQLLYKSNWHSTLNEQNFNALAPALRYVTKQFNVSIGTQFINKEQHGLDNTVRFIGTLSYTF